MQKYLVCFEVRSTGGGPAYASDTYAEMIWLNEKDIELLRQSLTIQWRAEIVFRSFTLLVHN